MKNEIKQYYIKKGTLLFRLSSTNDYQPMMFFGFSSVGALSSDCEDRRIKIWEVLQDFSLFYAIKQYTNEGSIFENRISILYDMYIEKYPNEKGKIKPLSVKQDKDKLNNLVEVLHEKGINGWVTSVEDKYDMELFLFEDISKMATLFKFCGLANENDPKLHEYDFFSKNNIM